MFVIKDAFLIRGGAFVSIILLMVIVNNRPPSGPEHVSSADTVDKSHGNVNAAPVLRTNMPSKRVLCYSDHGAGLSDRKAVFTQLIRWAKALDVQLRLQPPCLLLSPKHNHGQRLDCNITWSRYFDFPSGVLTNEPCSIHMAEFFKISKYVKQVKLYITDSQVTFSNYVKKQSILFMEHMTIPLAYDMIHLRRTDGLRECDTRLFIMEKLFKQRHFATNHIVYATDEKNETYNHAIVGFLRNRGLKVYFIEPEMRKRFINDNYMAYAIIRILLSRATRQHEWRRKFSCPQPLLT